ncbi:MAG: DUF4384 domain-containing protein, partial [Planctomycetaceae bacterium]|nr:DUF4384 domain-containing protein [Planctomycetaceae bacterium]
QDPGSDVQFDRGVAEFEAWSGTWWPHSQGGLQGPLQPYDQLTGAAAVAWEKENHAHSDSTPAWHGFCHAWAASSVMEPEPVTPALIRAADQTVRVSVGDQKGWLAACHAMDIANVYGDRFGDGIGSEDPDDLSPDWLWRLLQMYVRERRVPLILDIEAGGEVWNYPVYAYEVQCSLLEEDKYRGQMTLIMANNDVAPEFVGVRPKKKHYFFEFRMSSGALLPGSGRWTGDSKQDHPDFAWYPYVAVAENPEVNVELIQQLLASADTEPAAENLSGGNSERQSAHPSTTEPLPSPAASPEADSLRVRSEDGSLLISPSEMLSLVTDQTSDFLVDLQIPGVEGRVVNPATPFDVRVVSAEDGWVYVFAIDAAGELTLLFPVDAVQQNHVTAEQALSFHVEPDPRISAGKRIFKALVTRQPLCFSDLSTPGGSTRTADESGSDAAPSAGRFRYPPTLRKQLSEKLQDYAKSGAIPSGTHSPASGTDVPVEFGQDRVICHMSLVSER